MPYCGYEHFDRFIEGFGTLYYGSHAGGTGTVEINTTAWTNDITSGYNKVNMALDTINRIPNVPIGTESNGSYNQALIDWNCLEVIHTKLRARHFIDYNGNYPEWIHEFGSRAKQIEQGIVDGVIALETDTTNQGIGYPVRVAGTGKASFHSNYDFGFYYASDYERVYHFKITDVADGTLPNQAKFKISNDDGYSFLADEWVTATNWIDVEHGLQIRWGNNPNAGTNAMLVVGDQWKIKCTPVNKASIGQSSQYKTFKRG